MADVYVNGRRAVLQALDGLLAQEKNIKRLMDVFQAEIDGVYFEKGEEALAQDKTLNFWKTIVHPLMPKDVSFNEADADAENQQHVVIHFEPAPPKERKEGKEISFGIVNAKTDR